jgi:hypothetical protein
MDLQAAIDRILDPLAEDIQLAYDSFDYEPEPCGYTLPKLTPVDRSRPFVVYREGRES